MFNYKKIAEYFAESQKGRLVYWYPVFLSFGIGFYFSLKNEPPTAFGWGLLFLSYFVLRFLRSIKSDSKFHVINGLALVYLRSLCLAFILFLTGFVLAQFRTQYLFAPVIQEEIDYTEITGTIADIDRIEPDGKSWIILNNLEIEKLKQSDTPEKIRIRVYEGKGLRSGQRVRLSAGLSPPLPPVAPGAFDFRRYCWFRQIGATGFAYKNPEIIDHAKTSRESFLENARQSLSEIIYSNTSGAKSTIITALMTGEKKAIPEDDMNAMRDAGLAHLLSLSGLHVGMVAGFVFFAVRGFTALFPWFALRFSTKKVAAVTAMLAAFAFTAFVGASIPSMRAALMTGVVMIAIMLDRQAFTMRLVALSALVILALFPESLAEVSFQMSYAAVASLIWFYEQYGKWIYERLFRSGILGRFVFYFIGVCLTTIIASVATAPFSLYHFQYLAVYGNIANLIAVPLMSFVVMPFIILSYIAVPIGGEAMTFAIAGKGIEWILSTAHWAAGIEGTKWLSYQWSLSGFLLMILGSVFVMLWQGRGKYLGLVPVLFSILIIYNGKPPDLFVSSKADLVAFTGEYRNDAGETERALFVSDLRRSRFARNSWAQLSGLDENSDIIKFPKEGRSEFYDGLICGELGCRLQIKNKKIAIRKQPYNTEQDCKWADILIADYKVESSDCETEVIIDRTDVWREGAFAVYINNNGNVRVKSTADDLGSRPWANNYLFKQLYQ